MVVRVRNELMRILRDEILLYIAFGPSLTQAQAGIPPLQSDPHGSPPPDITVEWARDLIMGAWSKTQHRKCMNLA